MPINKERNLFHRAHYNILAKQIQKQYTLQLPQNELTYGNLENVGRFVGRRTLEELALSLGKRLKEDNPDFDPIMFLNNCSPDTDLYPLAELWED